MKQQPKDQYVYLIGCRSTNTLKIGLSVNPKKRLSTLQTSSPYRLSIIRTIPGGADVERLLHQEFQSLKMSGEWFKWSNKIIDRFESLANNR